MTQQVLDSIIGTLGYLKKKNKESIYSFLISTIGGNTQERNG